MDNSTLQSSSECVSHSAVTKMAWDTGGSEVEHNVHYTRYRTEQVCHSNNIGLVY